jgi:hypothetical protein
MESGGALEGAAAICEPHFAKHSAVNLGCSWVFWGTAPGGRIRPPQGTLYRFGTQAPGHTHRPGVGAPLGAVLKAGLHRASILPCVRSSEIREAARSSRPLLWGAIRGFLEGGPEDFGGRSQAFGVHAKRPRSGQDQRNHTKLVISAIGQLPSSKAELREMVDKAVAGWGKPITRTPAQKRACPSCGYTETITAHWVRCPRCGARKRRPKEG